MFSRVICAAAVAVALSCSAASAASLTVLGGSNFVLPLNYSLNDKTGPSLVSGDTVRRNGALHLSGPAKVTFAYLGSEADYSNRFSINSQSFHNKSGANAPFTLRLDAGKIDFRFRTDDGNRSVRNGDSSGYYNSIALFLDSNNPHGVIALLNDWSTSDKDYDDMAVRMTVAPVPLPAAAWLLVAGVGGLRLAARRRRRA